MVGTPWRTARTPTRDAKRFLAAVAGKRNAIAAGRLEIPIAKVYPLDEVREAYRELEQRHTRGKIVLEP